MSESLQVAIAGAGRMGTAIGELVRQHDAMQLAGIWTRGSDLDSLVAAADVVIDFSLPEGTAEVLDVVVARRVPLVCGVSGLGDAELAALDEAATVIPLVYDRNMSRGIAALNGMLPRLVAALGPDYALSIAETHHVHKKDAPSGTALLLGEALAKARGIDCEDIPIASERRGEVPGEHTVSMASASETLTLTHKVTTRNVFAEGAVLAAEWIVSQPSGRYSMQDVLFSNAKL